MKKTVLIITSITAFCFLLSECRSPKKDKNSGKATSEDIGFWKGAEKVAIALAGPAPQVLAPAKPEPIRITAYPDRISEPALVWEKFGSGVGYTIEATGSVWAYPDDRREGTLLTLSNRVPNVARWKMSFKSAETNSVEVVLRPK